MTRFLIVALAAAAAACSDGAARQQKGPAAAGPAGSSAAQAAVEVTTLRVEPRDVPVAFDAVGRTEGSREVQVRARVSGILERQLFSEGDSVKAGAPLFRIERAPFEIELQQARGALAQETARQELAQQELARLKGLADRRAISQKEADQAASSAQQSAAAVQIARARVRQAELNLSYTTVSAPIGGITGRALQSVGTLVQPSNESALLTTITRGDPIWVRFSLSEAEFARLRGSDRSDVEVGVELADGKPYQHKGKLNFAASTVDGNTGTVQMRAELPNPKQQLLPGQYVRVRMVAGSQQAIVVPQTAVMQNDTGRFVWVAGGDGKAVQRNIRAGGWLGEDWVVLDGLKAGEAVIVDNVARLRPGTPVQVKKAG
jgi:membrane fusion protein (multidrug efflux system)